MNNRRVVVTGLGIVSNIGIGKSLFWSNLIKGKTNISKINFKDCDLSQFRSKFVALVNDFNFEKYFDGFRHGEHLGRTSKFALVGAKLALEDACFDLEEHNKGKFKYSLKGVNAEKVSVILGVGGSIFDVIEDNYKNFFRDKGPRSFSRHLVGNISSAAPAIHITNTFGIHGTNYVVPCACASSNEALLDAFRRITLGVDDVVISGGADAFIAPASFGGFDAMKVFATKFEDEPNRAYRPFDKDRSGMIMAEASGIVILESLEHALNRGAKIYCEFANGSSRSDAYHIYRPDTSAIYMVKSMKDALQAAEVAPEQIDYINAHGSATEINDPLESKAFKKVFGKNAYNIPISSTKSMTAHSIGATGALEAAATSMSIYKSKIPPTINLDNPDIENGCDLDYVPNVARDLEVNYALSNSFGFGGLNTTIVLKKYRK